jgi:hypothetical protein
MSYIVDSAVSTSGLERSPVAASLAGLRAHEARCFRNKYDDVFTVESASKAKIRGPRRCSVASFVSTTKRDTRSTCGHGTSLPVLQCANECPIRTRV